MYLCFVKFIAFLLSIYILALNFAPCEDSVVDDNEIKIEISQNSDVDNSHTGLDLCSPFCQCHCCQIQATYYGLANLTLSTTQISAEVFIYFENLGKDFSNTILQPPRI